ncbi:chemotaxis protein CheC [Halorubellus sp. JP-L1]|uniref:chemotaxis protein CheC n=1 Tax=Halorubellus sp. JP-L1 TaxID=2715753 RepID=UPI00140BF810|nr:chemotaxis protein CheC [Halorubellus sp. JP-L1]NHN40103.1 chemotaxis protein CheC [Halorubellus sp. JP-L1]
MKLDIKALGTFYEMAREGAGLAAGRLTRMTGVETRVGVTKLNFMRGSEIQKEFDDGRDKVGIRVELSDGIDGHSVIVFDRESALEVVRILLDSADADEFDDMSRSAVTEVGQIMNAGFIDGWADVLETAIDVETPEFVEGATADAFIGDLAEAPNADDFALLFQSRIEAVDTEIEFRHYLFPERESMARVLDRHRDPNSVGIEYDKLAGFDEMAKQGAKEVASNITTLTGIDTEVEVRRLNFASLEAIPEEIDDEMLVGVAHELDGNPSGYLLFLFDEQSAREVVEATVPSPPDDEFGDLGVSAIKELGNIMASGFIDGWANVLDTTIDHSPPEYIHDYGAAVIDPVVIQLGEDQEFAFVFDTVMRANDREFDCSIYAIPDQADLERALNELDVEKVADAETKADVSIDELENA